MLTLYHSAAASCSVATHIALEEAGAQYKAVKVDLSKGEQRMPEYLAVNPKGRVPALVTPRGILSENVALLLYIAQTHAHANLAPLSDPYALAKMQAFNAYLASTVHVNHAHKARAGRWTDSAVAIETMKAKVPQNMTDCAAMIETEMLAGPWVMGNQFTVADCYLFINTMWMEGDGVDLSKFPKLTAHYAAMKKRPSVQKALAAVS
jgi:glutathione S-transferase